MAPRFSVDPKVKLSSDSRHGLERWIQREDTARSFLQTEVIVSDLDAGRVGHNKVLAIMGKCGANACITPPGAVVVLKLKVTAFVQQPQIRIKLLRGLVDLDLLALDAVQEV